MALALLGLWAAAGPPTVTAAQLGPMPQPKPATYLLAAGGVGGGWYNLSAALADLVNKQVPAVQINVVPGAGIANILRVGKNDVPFALGFPPFVKAMLDGTEPFKPQDKYPDIRSVIGGFSFTYLTFAVAQDVPLNSLEELLQKKYPLKIAVDRVGTTDEWSLRSTLKLLGATYDDIRKWGGSITFTGYNDQADLMKDKHVNAVWQNIAAPSPSLADVMRSRTIRVLPLPEGTRRQLIEKFAFADRAIPANVYGNDKPIGSAASVTTLYTNSRVAEDPVYVLTRVLLENPATINKAQASAEVLVPERAWKETGADLHPGAARYYREKGLMK
jgi:TRAP transporter TAXI family solute receptor